MLMLILPVGVWFLGRSHATPPSVGREGVGGERGRLVNLRGFSLQFGSSTRFF